MNILMVLDKEFPPDERVEKEIESLIRAGYHVSIAVYTRKGSESKEIVNNYTIYRKIITPFLYKSSAATLLHPFYFGFWYRFLDTILSAEKFDIIHVHDLPLAKVGYKLSVKHHLKLVCDQHEYYSNWIIRTKHYNTLPGKIIRFLSPWKRYERIYLSKADLVITVADSLRSIYINKVGIQPDKIITLPNTPEARNFRLGEIDESIVNRFKNYFVLFYAGSLDHLRGLEFIMECLSILKNEIPNILFVIAGKENSAFSINDLITKFNTQAVTQYIGWVPLHSLSSYIAASNVCLFVPRANNLEINNTIATKIYQYAAMGKPVIVSEARMMKDFVQLNHIGFSVTYGDVKEFCTVVKKLYLHPEISDEIKQQAVNIASRNTWENTSTEFIRYYSKMI
jgi:glycosyltransferase involved in cell wall biosynthesis